MRFLKDRECDNGKNHTTQGDCRAKVSIHTSEARSDQVGRHTADFELPLPFVNHLTHPFKKPPCILWEEIYPIPSINLAGSSSFPLHFSKINQLSFF